VVKLGGSRSAGPIFEVAACWVRERQREGIALALSGVPTGAGRGLSPPEASPAGSLSPGGAPATSQHDGQQCHREGGQGSCTARTSTRGPCSVRAGRSDTHIPLAGRRHGCRDRAWPPHPRRTQAATGVSQDHDGRCWASLRKPLEDQDRVTMLSTCHRIGDRRRRGPRWQELAAGRALTGNCDIRQLIGGVVSRWERGWSGAVPGAARWLVTCRGAAARPTSGVRARRVRCDWRPAAKPRASAQQEASGPAPSWDG